MIFDIISISSCGFGYVTVIFRANLSTCTSLNGYVPAISYGVCVAITRNGVGRGRVCPSIVTCFSCIASIRADCVFGDALFSSSVRTMFANIGPFLRVNFDVCGLYM